MPKNITGGCSSCNGTGMIGGGEHVAPVGGARRRQHHMLQDMRGVEHRQNQVINGVETIQQNPSRAVGSGMGFRDQSVRMAHRDRARMRSMEDPRYSHWRGDGGMSGGNPNAQQHSQYDIELLAEARKPKLPDMGARMRGLLALATPVGKAWAKAEATSPVAKKLMGSGAEGGGWWDKIKNEFTNPNSKLRGEIAPKVASEAWKHARPLVESVGNQLGKQVGVDNLGTYADKGLKLVGQGKLSAKHHKMAKESGMCYRHGKSWYIGDRRMTVKDLKAHKMSGGGFWGDVWNGVKKVGRAVVAPAGNALGAMVGMPMAGTFADQGLKLAGLGRSGGNDSESDEECMNGGGYANPSSERRQPLSAHGGRGRSARAEIVKKVMREKGLSMIEASKYVKAHGLY